MLALNDANEITRNHSALVDKLIEGVLPIGPRIPEINLSGIVGEAVAINANTLAIALHGHLRPASA